jgi:AraC family transcriptional regulator of adaptative response / DNA-3-methyladenine glycosylase II
VNLDARVLYESFVAHDRRLDGRVFAGVVTTGIYCRPVCPVRPAKLENCRFFPSAAAAEETGFRPCRRCRPETAPGTPAWAGTSATVARALRLIDAGALDGCDEEAFAGRLGIGARHLRRLFVAHLGATPGAVARTRRLHLARRLIDETTLPMTEVAFAAGFASVRRFNEAIGAAWGKSPGELRRDARARPAVRRFANATRPVGR